MVSKYEAVPFFFFQQFSVGVLLDMVCLIIRAQVEGSQDRERRQAGRINRNDGKDDYENGYADGKSDYPEDQAEQQTPDEDCYHC